MRVSVSPPRGYLNWDTTDNNKIFDICIPRSSIHFEHQLTQPIISHGVLHDKGNHQLPTWDYLLNKICTISMCMLRFWTINIQLQCIKRSDHKRKQNFSWPRTNHNNRPKITSIANCSRKKDKFLSVIWLSFSFKMNNYQYYWYDMILLILQILEHLFSNLTGQYQTWTTDWV